MLLGRTEVLCGSAPCPAESVAVPGCVKERQSGVSMTVGAGGKRGCSHHFFPRRLPSDTCSDFSEEEGLKRNFSSPPSVGNDGVSFSCLGFSF